MQQESNKQGRVPGFYVVDASTKKKTPEDTWLATALLAQVGDTDFKAKSNSSYWKKVGLRQILTK